jgi:hypothetical protein
MSNGGVSSRARSHVAWQPTGGQRVPGARLATGGNLRAGQIRRPHQYRRGGQEEFHVSAPATWRGRVCSRPRCRGSRNPRARARWSRPRSGSVRRRFRRTSPTTKCVLLVWTFCSPPTARQFPPRACQSLRRGRFVCLASRALVKNALSRIYAANDRGVCFSATCDCHKADGMVIGRYSVSY